MFEDTEIFNNLLDYTTINGTNVDYYYDLVRLDTEIFEILLN